MHAVVIDGHGDVDVLVERELPDLVPGPGQVLVSVRACALNRLDLWVRQGWRGLDLSFPHVLGSDVAGVVDGLGPGVTGLERGDEVVLNPGTSCGTCVHCSSGADNLCGDYAILGEGRDGGYAEQVVVPAANVLPKPAGLDWAEAAAIPLVFLTAWQMLVDKADVQPGETVLVHAGGSGVGSAAIQVARLRGARVVTTASTRRKLDMAAELGAHHGVDYSDGHFARDVREWNGGSGVDVVVEHTGKATWEESLAVLRRGGRLVTCGATSGWDARTDLRRVFLRQLTVYGSTMGPKSALVDILRHVETGALRAVIDDRLPRTRAGATEGHERLRDRAQFGKLVLVREG